jgi:hypothetical protein
MKYIIFGRAIVVTFYINLIEPDYVNKKITLYTSAAALVENFDTAEQLTERLVAIATELKIDEEDLLKLTIDESIQ